MMISTEGSSFYIDRERVYLLKFMEIKNILSKLVSFKTITGDRDVQLRAFQWIKSQLKELPVYFREIEKNKVASLLITTQKTKTPTLWLAGHLDVVEGTPKVFKPYLKKNKLYGRGAFDMKFALACYLKLFQELGKSLPKHDLGIMITTDEEVGGWNGTQHLLEKGYLSKICLLPDGGKNWEIERSAKGVWHLKLESFGESSHGSRPWLGKNAIDQLIAFYKELSLIFPKEPCGDKNHHHSTLNIGKIKGGKTVNQVPDYAEAFLDIRFTSPTEKKRIENEISKLKKKYKKISVKTLVLANSFQQDLKSPYHQLFIKIAKENFGIKMNPIDSQGSSDGRFFVEKNVPVIITRPRGGGHHSEEEWIDLKDLDKFYLVLKEFVKEVSLLNEKI